MGEDGATVLDGIRTKKAALAEVDRLRQQPPPETPEAGATPVPVPPPTPPPAPAATAFVAPREGLAQKTPAQVAADHPDLAASVEKGQYLVEVLNPDGTIEVGEFNGWYDLTAMDPKFGGVVGSFARIVEGKWSHGFTKPGAKILTKVPSPEEWAAGVRPEAGPPPPAAAKIAADVAKAARERGAAPSPPAAPSPQAPVTPPPPSPPGAAPAPAAAPEAGTPPASPTLPAAPPTGPGPVGLGGAAAAEPGATATPVPIPPIRHPSLVARIQDAVHSLISKPQGVDTPLDPSRPTPLPDFQPHAQSKAIFSQPFGWERLPGFGVLTGGLRRVEGAVPESVVTYFGERGVGRAVASAFANEFSWLRDPWEIKDGQIVNIGRTSPEQSLFEGDVFEGLQRDPNAYVLDAKQRQAFDTMQGLEEDFRYLQEKYDVGNVQDNEGVDIDATLDPPPQEVRAYFPRQVVSRPEVGKEGLTRGESVGAKAFFEKPRMFETEAEGWEKGFRYETDIVRRMAIRVERLYKRIADKRLIHDPALGGTTRKNLLARLREDYAEELGAGLITDAKLEQMADSIESRGRVYQPGFFGKIYPEETARELNKAFPTSAATLRQSVASVNNALKALWLGFDLGVGFIQGQGLIAYNPHLWGKATVSSLRAMLSREYFPEYVRRNNGAIREMAQLGSSVGRMEEMLSGAERGGIIHQLPGVRQTLGRAIEPFARQFQTFLDVAKVELWKSLREVTPREEWGRTIQSIESVLSTARMEAVGISGRRAFLERALFIAPSYYRGALNLVGAMAEKGVPGATARRALGFYLAGGAILFYVVAKALGMKDEDIRRRFNPSRGDFLMWKTKVGGRPTEIGFGGIFKSLLRLGGNIARTSIEHPGDWKSLSPEKNPITRWYRGHAGPVVGIAWDLFSGRDYLGRQVGVERLGTVPLPMTVRVMMDPRQPLNPLDLGATFLGLSAYDRPNEGQQEIGRLANQFLREKGRPRPRFELAPEESSYATLWNAIRAKDDAAATKILGDLQRTRKPGDIMKAFNQRLRRPFTGSRTLENAFYDGLSPREREFYRQARAEQLAEIKEAYRLWSAAQNLAPTTPPP